MPRFDPHYLTEHDGTRLREAQSALVNARGHYLGAAPAIVSAGVRLLPSQIAPALKRLSASQKRQAIKNNKSKVVAELRAKGIQNITVNDDGTLHLGDFASSIDAAARAVLNTPTPSFVFDQATKKVKPGPVKKLSDSIDALPLLNAEQKRAVKQAPFTTMLNAVTGVLGVLNNPQAGILVKVLKETGTVFDLSTFPFNIPGATRVDISLVQDGDELFDEPSRSNLLRLRTLTAFVVLYFRKWVELHAAFADVGWEFLFGKPDPLVSTVGEQKNTPQTATVVDRLPAAAERGTRQNERLYEGTINNKIVYRVTKAGAGNKTETTYYTLSSKGLSDRRDALREDYDRKYAAYVQDFKFWHPDFATRVGVVKFAEGKTEQQAVNKVAGEYNLPQRFAEERNLPAKFRVTAPDRLGGPAVTGAKNGTRTNLQGFAAGSANRALGALGTFGAEIAAIIVALEGFCVSVGPVVTVAIVTGVFLTTAFAVGVAATIILAAMGKEFSFFVDVKEGKAGASTKQEPLPDSSPQEPPTLPGDAGGTLQTQSAGGGGVSPLLIGGAVLAALFIFKKGSRA